MDDIERYTQEAVTELWEQLGAGLTRAVVGLVNQSYGDLTAGLDTLKDAFKELNNAFAMDCPAPRCDFIEPPSDDPADRQAEIDAVVADIEAAGAPPEVLHKMKRTMQVLSGYDPGEDMEPEPEDNGVALGGLLAAIEEALANDPRGMLIISARKSGDEPEPESNYRPGNYA